METMVTGVICMDAKLLRYYKKKMHGGRSIAARVTDFVVFRLFMLFIIFIIVLYLTLSTTAALLIAVFLTAAASLAMTIYNRKKAEKYILKDMTRLKQKCLLERLTFMKAGEYSEYINSLLGGRLKNVSFDDDGLSADYKEKSVYVFHCHPGSECGVSDVLKIIRSYGGRDMLILSLSEFSRDAKTMCKSLPYGVELLGGKSILSLAEKADMLSGEEEAEKHAEKEMKDTIKTLEDVKSSAFSKAKIKGYIICGIVIMCWPLVTGFRIYYPIISIICFAMAFLTYRRSKPQGKESSDIGIS